MKPGNIWWKVWEKWFENEHKVKEQREGVTMFMSRQSENQPTWNRGLITVLLCEYLIGHRDQRKTTICNIDNFIFWKKCHEQWLKIFARKLWKYLTFHLTDSQRISCIHTSNTGHMMWTESLDLGLYLLLHEMFAYVYFTCKTLICQLIWYILAIQFCSNLMFTLGWQIVFYESCLVQKIVFFWKYIWGISGSRLCL